jgi:acyl-CoA thioesterase-2
MGRALSALIDNLDVEKIEMNLFRGQTLDRARDNVYGGQILAQAINAAGRTVARPLMLHSLHAYFLREGDAEAPVIFEVDRIRDGRTFTTRRVVAIQHGRAIFNVSLSYHVPEEHAVSHANTMPEVEGPEKLINDEVLYSELADNTVVKAWPFEYRQVDPINPKKPEKKNAKAYAWFKSNGELADDQALHQELLAYATDYLLLQTILRPHGEVFWSDKLQLASLDYSLWLHRPIKVDEWLLYEMESTVAFGARGFCRGSVYNQQGELVASTSQEGLIRMRENEH